ncbi:hypothetical protein I3843_08G044300 [Carya illinoinensis]|uniref:60S ribosomal protein L13 n=1 Tax=Carya illinoinensis TaxID=32201 RepID=A0A922J928_CARIL|nr:hypothetical protein I3760_08G044700 [Carya illinoinensis]KAG6698930.1 hypothetical protein I3842_08G044600 [Carya illinoinensis]KAG7966307.1 hypothetical protein I3843_08G044300 [Carya illinoinensis]
MKHNNVIPNGHFKKQWQNYVKTWFNQPARKTRRRIARQKKAVKIFPRPTSGPLRPIVHGQTLKYNMKVKAGDSAPEELATATQVQGSYMPIVREKPSVELVKITEEMKSFKAYDKLRIERTNTRHVGARMKRAAEAEKEEKK